MGSDPLCCEGFLLPSTVPTYQGGLDENELLDQINEMDKFFDYDETYDERKVKFAVTTCIIMVEWCTDEEEK